MISLGLRPRLIFLEDNMNAQKVRICLIFAILAMFAACAWIVYSKVTEVIPQTQILKIREQLRPEKPEIVVPEVILKINSRNSNIESFVVEKMRVKTWEKGARFKLDGSLFYKKDLFFRMQISSLFGEELDLGANDKIFWYWSRRDRQPGLYYAFYEDFTATRLKTPFNPMFLRVSLGLEEIDTKNAKIVSKNGFIAIVTQTINAMNQRVLYTLFVNEEKERIEGCLITDLNDNPLASCEIQSFSGDLPEKILYTWHEEKKMMLLEFENPQENVEISDTKWEIPRKEPKINMAEEMMTNLPDDYVSETEQQTAK
jgi:hypothetical protein